MIRRKPGIATLWAVICGVTHLTAILIVIIAGKQLLVDDAAVYKMLADNLVRLGMFTRAAAPPYLWEPYRPPGFPTLIAFSISLLGDYRFALGFSVLTAGIAGWSIVKLTQEWGGNSFAQHISGFLMAFLPNSLGLSARLLTDAPVAHLTIFWIYLIVTGFKEKGAWRLILSPIVLLILQSFRPTYDYFGLVLLGLGMIYLRTKKAWIINSLLIVSTLLLPAYFGSKIYQDYGIVDTSFIGIETARDYLQARYVSRVTGTDFPTARQDVQAADAAAANRLTQPASFYGRLYLVEKAQVDQFLRQEPLQAAYLAGREMFRQFFAPQDFANFLLPDQAIPGAVLALESAFTILIWGFALYGFWYSGRQGNWRPGLCLLGVLAFFLVTGSISTYVGGRLRLAGDLTALPLASIGLWQARSIAANIFSKLKKENRPVS